jgi:hypothetical protein
MSGYWDIQREKVEEGEKEREGGKVRSVREGK